jgi:hypothetical protein
MTWIIGVNSLSWEFRKLTWIILTFVVLESSTSAPLETQDPKKLSSGSRRLSRKLGDSIPETKVI